MIPIPLLLFAGMLSSAPSALAQGTGAYLNVESPQRKPIAIARVEGHDYLVACNTPDGCVEIYDTHGNGFLLRVQTGAEPISVVYNDELEQLFTCNFLGDSISVIQLSAPGSSGPLSATLLRTTIVGDEPNHLAFAPDNQSLFVTLGSQSAVAELFVADLSPAYSGSEWIDLVDNLTTPTKALKDPCTALVSNNQLFVLGLRAGKSTPLAPGCNEGDPCDPTPFGNFDFAVRAVDLTSGAINEVSGLGTLNFNMQFDLAGDLWVVGTDAKFDLIGEAAVAAEPFGFVRSMIYKVTGAGTATPVVRSRDLNQADDGSQMGSNRSVSQPTDLAIYEPGGTLTKVFVAGFNSDRVGVLTNLGQPAPDWVISQITVPTASGSTNPMSGPRGLALKYASGISGDPGARLYVLNRLDNAVSVINPANNNVLSIFALQRDPTPQYIRSGREFLYGSHHSGNGIVSCASCHVDGRSDFLRWNLSDNSSQAFPAGIKDGVVNDPNGTSTHWPPNKDFLVTQTLQGMVNFETQPEVQSFFSNEPLHWRGDREDFLAFNPAFVNLLGRSSALSAQQMEAYRDFVFSIAYPPNPEQLTTRTLTGAFGSTADLSTGNGAKYGLKLYQMKALAENAACAGRSCVQCHALPEGSNNKLTEFVANTVNSGNRQPMETPGIRLMRQKERRIEIGPLASGNVRTGLFGLLHEGSAASINHFIQIAFPQDMTQSELNDVKKFVREFDTGVGPIVGQSYSVFASTITATRTTTAFNLFEAQAAKANCGLVAQLSTSTGLTGYWYDLTVATPIYREDQGGTTLPRSGLLALLTQSSDVLVLHVTPLGSERRVAWQSTGAPPALTGIAPMNITLEDVLPNTMYRNAPVMTANWIPVEVSGGDFDWLGDDAPLAIPTPPELKAIRLFQWGLVQDGPQYGLTALRHEYPRRFRVALDNGRHGARLRLKMGDDQANPPPNSTSFVVFELPIYPTDQVNAEGHKIWETAVEADPVTLYTLMHGGPLAPNVQATLDGSFSPTEPPPTSSYDPSVWNSFVVEVVNEDTTSGSGGWQSITIQ